MPGRFPMRFQVMYTKRSLTLPPPAPSQAIHKDISPYHNLYIPPPHRPSQNHLPRRSDRADADFSQSTPFSFRAGASTSISTTGICFTIRTRTNANAILLRRLPPTTKPSPSPPPPSTPKTYRTDTGGTINGIAPISNSSSFHTFNAASSKASSIFLGVIKSQTEAPLM